MMHSEAFSTLDLYRLLTALANFKGDASSQPDLDDLHHRFYEFYTGCTDAGVEKTLFVPVLPIPEKKV